MLETLRVAAGCAPLGGISAEAQTAPLISPVRVLWEVALTAIMQLLAICPFCGAPVMCILATRSTRTGRVCDVRDATHRTAWYRSRSLVPL